jgi:hypothetical protein
MEPLPSFQQQPGKRARDSDVVDDFENSLFIEDSPAKRAKVDHDSDGPPVKIENKSDGEAEPDESDMEDDASDASDIGEDGQGYDEEQEALPNHAAYDPEMQQIEEQAIKHVGEVLVILQQSGCESERVKMFTASCERLQTVPEGRPLKIGMWGKSGDGKHTST